MRDGRLAPGSRLPAELRLAERFKVSRNTVRMALAELNEQGLIRLGHRKWLVKDDISPSHTALANSVFIVVQDSDSPLEYSHRPKTSAHFNHILLGALSALRKDGYDAFVANPGSVRNELVHRVISQRPKGTLILSNVLQEEAGRHLADALQQGNVPTVIYGDFDYVERDASAITGFDSIVSDHEKGSYELTRWLIGQGRKRILRYWRTHMENPENRLYWAEQRDLGYLRAMKEAGLEPLPALDVYDPTYRAYGLSQHGFDYCVRVAAGYLLEYVHGPNSIDAIITSCDDSIGLLSAAVALHGKVPNKDVLMAGYDNMWDDLEEMQKAGFKGPAVTVDKLNLEIGANLVALLEERMNGKLFSEPERRVMAPALVIRPEALA